MKRKHFIIALMAMLFSFSFTTSAQQLLVNCDYNSSTEGWGTTKFSNYAGAYAYATANSKTSATIVIEKTNTLSGNTFDNNHKNYSKLAVVIQDGATMGNAASKWDMTYPVTVKPGGTLTCARPKTASVSNIHIKNTLTVGEKGSTKKAYVNFLSDSYQDCDISIRYNGKILVYNADFAVQDLDAQGTLTIEDSEVAVDGAFACATTFYKTTLTNTNMVVNDNQIEGGLSDFKGGDSNQLGNITITNSSLTIKEGDTKVAANVIATNSTIAVNNLTVNSGKTLNLNDGSALNAENITTAGTGSVKIDGNPAKIENGQIVNPVAQVGTTKYYTFAEAAAAAQAGSEIKLLANIEGDITVPANVTLNGNGFAISGGILAEGDITFAGVTTAADFDAKVVNTAVNIPAGASLQLTGSARLVIGHGATFNITGTIEDAKTADKATLVPSLKIAAGASITGNGVTFNVNNAYIVANANTTSKNSSANGTLDFNINNSIWEQTGVLAFYVPTSGKDPVVNFELKNSVLTTTSHLVFSVTKGEIVFDNSLVNQGASRQIENRSTMTIKNGSVVNGAVATSSNAINPGTIIVDNATYAVTGEFSGAAEGKGTLVIKKGANVSVGSIKAGANVTVDAEGMAAGDEINFTANLSQFTGELSVINNDKLEAQIVNGKVVLAAKPVAKIGETPYTTLEAAFAAATEGQTITILSGTHSEGTIKLPATLKNVTINGESVARSTEGAVLKDMTISAADGNAYNYEGLTFDGITFDNSRILLTGWRNGDEIIKNLAVTNCTFKNLNDNTNTAPIHINKEASEPVNGFTFTNNVIDGATGGSKSGIYAQVTGEVKVENNIINNVSFRPYVIQVTTDDGIADNFTVKGNTFSGSAVGRAQGLGNNAEGTDNVNLVVSNNIFKGITDAQQICYWNFNPEKTTADLSKNYYDIDIVKNPGKIYYNAAATGVEDLLAMNVYPFYTALNEDGTINTASLKEAPVAKVIYPVGNSEYADGAVVYYDTMLEAVPNTSNCPRLEGATIQLIRDASAKGLRLMENGMVLDLNGKTYTITEATGSKGTETSGFQIRPEVTTGATIQNGTINVAEGTNVVWLFNSYATDFVLNNVVVDCANLNWNYGEQCKVLVNRKGDNVQLTGNTEFQNFDSNVAPNAMSIEGTMTIGDDVKLGNMTIEMATTTTINGPQGLNVVTDNSDYAVIWNNGVYSTTYSDYISEFTINDGEYTEFEFDCLNGVANVGTLTYKRKIYDKDLYDLFVPFEIPVSELMQLGFQVFYINDFRSFDSSGREQLVLESVLIEDGILRANHPYLFRFVGDDIPTEGLVLTLENAVLYSTNSENHTVVDCSSAYKKFEIKGTYNTMSSDELNGSLILGAGNKWGPIVGGYSLKPFRLTLTISNRDGSPVKIEEPVAVRLFGVDAETAIDDVEMTYSDENTIFDLQGRRVQKPVKGNLYIINGKKVVY